MGVNVEVNTQTIKIIPTKMLIMPLFQQHFIIIIATKRWLNTLKKRQNNSTHKVNKNKLCIRITKLLIS